MPLCLNQYFKKCPPLHQLSSSLLTRARRRQLYQKKIMPKRCSWLSNTERSWSWIIALHIRTSLNPPLESNRNHAVIEIWVAAANYTVSLLFTQAYQCRVPTFALLSTFFSSLAPFHSNITFIYAFLSFTNGLLHQYDHVNLKYTDSTIHNCVNLANISSNHHSFIKQTTQWFPWLAHWDSCGAHWVWDQTFLKYNIYYWPQMDLLYDLQHCQ